VKFRDSIDEFVVDMRSAGRINSDGTEVSYRSRLLALSDEVKNRDPRLVGREDVKRALRNWSHPNTQHQARSVYVSYFDWMMEEGMRDTNPARQTRRPKRRAAKVYRLTRAEVVAMLDASVADRRERRAVHLGICLGMRNAEMRRARGSDFARDGWVRVLGKGDKERWEPVVEELEPVVAEIREHVAADHYVLPAERWVDPPRNTRRRELPRTMTSSQSLRRLVMRVAERAGIAAHVHPHLLRHAFGDHIGRYAGVRNAQALMGHASIETTTAIYMDRPTLDELQASVRGFRFRVLSPRTDPATPEEATTGIEPVYTALQAAA
jgi:integrase/recombinase XerD